MNPRLPLPLPPTPQHVTQQEESLIRKDRERGFLFVDLAKKYDLSYDVIFRVLYEVKPE